MNNLALQLPLLRCISICGESDILKDPWMMKGELKSEYNFELKGGKCGAND